MTFSASSFDQSNRCMDYMLPKSMQNKSKLMVLSPLIFQMHPKTPELQPLLFEYSCTTFWNQEQVTDLLQDVHSDTWLLYFVVSKISLEYILLGMQFWDSCAPSRLYSSSLSNKGEMIHNNFMVKDQIC